MRDTYERCTSTYNSQIFSIKAAIPCKAGIEESLAIREKLKDSPDLDFVFITDMSGSPDAKLFKEYNEKNHLLNSYRISADEYLLLRELFKFNGIPRYVLVDANGRIKNELVKYYPQKFTPAYFK